MDFRLKRAMFGLAAALAATGGASAATLVVAPDSGCGKASCFGDGGVYTRTWSAKDVVGPVSIWTLLLDRAVLGALGGETFRISFSLNGEELGAWGHFSPDGLGGEVLSFSGQDVFWNPADGDLVLTLALDMAPKDGGGLGGGFLRSPSSDGDPPAFGGDDETGGAFSFRQAAIAAPAPEPASWALMIAGFGLTGATLRARRPAPARAD